MNVPKIIVFVDTPSTGYQTSIVNNLIAKDFVPMVDSINCNRMWFLKNMVGPHRLLQNSFFNSYTVQEWDADNVYLKPSLCIYYNNDCEITKDEFFEVTQYFKAIIHGMVPDSVPEKYLERPSKIVQADSVQINTVDCPQDNDSYSFRKIYHEQKDVMFYEVRKPHTDRPYVTYTYNFSNAGHLAFFTNLFVCSSWGVSHQDINFLSYAWTHLEMPGTFDMEELLRAHVERCTPGEGRIPEAEPDVYRRTIEEVMYTFQKRQDGKQVQFN